MRKEDDHCEQDRLLQGGSTFFKNAIQAVAF